MAVEIRYDDEGGIDEIVAPKCSVHLERLDTDTWMLVIVSDDTKASGRFCIYRRKNLVECGVMEIDMSSTTPERGAVDG